MTKIRNNSIMKNIEEFGFINNTIKDIFTKNVYFLGVW